MPSTIAGLKMQGTRSGRARSRGHVGEDARHRLEWAFAEEDRQGEGMRGMAGLPWRPAVPFTGISAAIMSTKSTELVIASGSWRVAFSTG
jgi:hypothetical protein